MRDDAEGTAVVAAFGNLQIGVVARGELHSLWRDQRGLGVVRRRRGLVDGLHHAVEGLRSRDGEHIGKAASYRVGRRAEAPRHDHLAVLDQGRADGLERLGLGAIEEPARVDDHEVGAGVRAGQLVAFGPQLRDDALAVDESFGAAERDERDSRGGLSLREGGNHR